MDCQLVGKVASLRNLDRVDLADQVGDRDVRRGELIAVAIVPIDPRHLDRLPVLGDEVQATPADRRVWVVVDLTARDRGYLRVEKADQRAHDPALGLAALAPEA